MGPTWGPPGSDRTQVGPMLVPWSLLSGCHSMEECGADISHGTQTNKNRTIRVLIPTSSLHHANTRNQTHFRYDSSGVVSFSNTSEPLLLCILCMVLSIPSAIHTLYHVIQRHDHNQISMIIVEDQIGRHLHVKVTRLYSVSCGNALINILS